MSLRKRHIALFLSLAAACVACRNDALPDNVVDTATLAQFLTEAHLVDSYYNTSDNRDTARPLVDAAYDSLYAKYGIGKEQYDSTIAYYLHTPQVLEEVYSRVLRNLNDYTDRKLKDRWIADSIANAQNPDSSAERLQPNLREDVDDRSNKVKVLRSIRGVKGVKHSN